MSDFSKVTLLIIAGGNSSRMHEDKRLIEVGEVDLLERILIKATKENFAEIFLCVEDFVLDVEILAMKYDVNMVFDKIHNAGPMSGLYEGLSNISTEWALAVSCDMPFFEFETVAPLMKELSDVKVVMYEHQPLAAFYHKSMAEEFSRSIANGQRKLQLTINQLPHKIIKNVKNEEFFNVNTKADLKLARGRAANESRRVPVVSIIAPESGTGKTTFITSILPRLIESGLKVGVIKSTHHKISDNEAGKDSEKLKEAGAQFVSFDFECIDNCESVDLILTESRTHSTKPAISLYRGLGEPLINDDVVALFTDRLIEIEDTKQFDINDIAGAVEVIKFLCARTRS